MKRTQEKLRQEKAFLLPASNEAKLNSRIKTKNVEHPRINATLCDLNIFTEVVGADKFPEAVLIQPIKFQNLVGIDASTVKVFRYNIKSKTFEPIWNSGINRSLGFIWAKIRQAGVYVPIGLPRDRLLQQCLRSLAHDRSLQDFSDKQSLSELIANHLAPFLELKEDVLDDLRQTVTKFEIDTAPEIPLSELNMGTGGHTLPFHLPNGMSLGDFRKKLKKIEYPLAGFPEEQLFRPLDICPPGGPWSINPEILERIRIDQSILKFDTWILSKLWWLFSKDWPMYQHDTKHSGRASGSSTITASTASQLTQRFKVALDGPVNSKPSIVNNRAYIGTSRSYGGPGGTLFKVNICNGAIEGRFPTLVDPHYYPIHGIGGSPSVYNGRVYFTTVSGKVYCVDAATMTPNAPHPPAIWITDLKNPNASKRQPVSNPSGDCWTSVLVVNDKVYVGSGEGEVSTCWGFIWCLSANTGEVLWLFCTNKAVDINNPGNENQPNRIPRAAAVSDPLPAWATAAGFSLMNNPAETGSSPWSSFAYDTVLNRVYIGTGNSQYVGSPPASSVAPDQRYGSGLISLDADTGQFRGFHTAQPDDSYHPNDGDIDVPGAPTIFYRGSERVICYGSKNGSFFLLDPDTLQVLGGGGQRRQLLPRQGGTGHPGNRGNAIAGVATSGGIEENKWGVMATPAIHYGSGKIFVGLGGYVGAGDGTKTPFVRALNWNNLNDAWPTVLGADGITRYSLANPPLYQRQNEAALSSPAVVNDVVFVSTTDPANGRMSLYALDVATGLCLWVAPIISTGGWPYYALGPAISGEYIVMGAHESLYVYTKSTTPWCLRKWPPFEWFEWREYIRPFPFPYPIPPEPVPGPIPPGPY
jgi:outer membrane protein assembly factor BamB